MQLVQVENTKDLPPTIIMAFRVNAALISLGEKKEESIIAHILQNHNETLLLVLK